MLRRNGILRRVRRRRVPQGDALSEKSSLKGLKTSAYWPSMELEIWVVALSG